MSVGVTSCKHPLVSTLIGLILFVKTRIIHIMEHQRMSQTCFGRQRLFLVKPGLYIMHIVPVAFIVHRPRSSFCFNRYKDSIHRLPCLVHKDKYSVFIHLSRPDQLRPDMENTHEVDVHQIGTIETHWGSKTHICTNALHHNWFA